MEYPNWFACYADDFFARHLSHLAGKPDLRFLQIGAFTGDASVWLLDNVLTDPSSVLVDVDTWEGSAEPEHEPFNWLDVRRTYLDKVSRYRGVDIWTATSREYFSEPHGPFDFIYIDGSHTAPDVLADAVHSFDALHDGGLMAFDDYQWKPHSSAFPQECPGLAIDAFTSCYRDRLDILEAGLQVWVRKK